MAVHHRVKLAMLATAVLLMSGCSGAASQSLDDACDTVKTGVVQISALMTDAVTASINGDGDTAGDLSAEMRAQASQTAEALNNERVKSAYHSVHEAFDDLADTLSGSAAADSAAIEAKTNAVQTASADLLELCGNTDDTGDTEGAPAVSGGDVALASYRTADVDDVKFHTFRPAMKPGQARTIDFTVPTPDVPVTWAKVTLDKAERSVFKPATWGKDWVVTVQGEPLNTYAFTDESGDTYSVFIFDPDPRSHTIYFNSDKPNLVSATMSKL